MTREPLPMPPDVLANGALFLDFDGTLVDIAETPGAVTLPPDLPERLSALARRLDGALAIVTGRPLDSLDAVLAPLRLPAAGEHGAVLRPIPDSPSRRVPTPPLPDAWRRVAESLAAAHSGAIAEQKHAGFVLHYRAAPDAGPQLRAALDELLENSAFFALMPAAMAWEVKATGIDKGSAVHALMQGAPFRGRRPVFIGDDHTDEDGMAACRALGGFGFRVQDSFGDAAGVRAWLARLTQEVSA